MKDTDYKVLYEQEMERQYWQKREEEERQYKAYQEREAKRKEERRAWIEEASSWTEAFHKNECRLKVELRTSQEALRQDKGEGETWVESDRRNIYFWAKMLEINRVAESSYSQEMRSIQPVINRLRRWIAILEKRALKRAHQTVLERCGDTEIVDCLLDGNPRDLLQW